METADMITKTFCPSATDCSTCARAGTCDWNGINKLTVFDIFARIPAADAGEPFSYMEVRFKNSRKEIYRAETTRYYVGMPVLVEADKGYDLGVISATGETARMIFRERYGDQPPEKFKKIYRPANQKEIDLWQKLRAQEDEVKLRSRKIAKELGLEMKISDVEYQADGSKVTFYYTAEDRVDFRELIKVLAKEFSTRIEMRQIGYRQEAARVGGLGSCGRELCCSTWLTDFRSVTTQAAKYQQLALNPSKLTGQCGKLKCCLNFELDTYKDALEEFPSAQTILSTEKGEAKAVKMDVFKKMIWYTYKDSDSALIYKLSLKQVQDILELNRRNQKAAPLEMYADDLKIELEHKPAVTLQHDEGDITRFDRPKTKSKNAKKKNRQTPRNGEKKPLKKQRKKKNENKKRRKR